METHIWDFLYEASEKCDGAAVKLKFVRESGQTMLSVENDFAKEPSVAGSQFLTSKTEDAKMHGIGIGNIRETVEEYGGLCVIRHEGRTFRFVMLIPE